MCRGLARTLLLLLLLAISGQAVPAPCAAGAPIDPPAPGEMNGGHPGHGQQQAGMPLCDQGSGNHSDCDCEQNCICCPGHCAGALPAGESRGGALPGNPLISRYAEISASPLPETTLRPPISR